MPLFRDPDRRRHYLWSPDHDNREHSTTGSSMPQLNELNHQLLNVPEMTGTAVEHMELSQSELNLPKSWTNDREELIHRIKESSPWRQHTVCFSLFTRLADLLDLVFLISFFCFPFVVHHISVNMSIGPR